VLLNRSFHEDAVLLLLFILLMPKPFANIQTNSSTPETTVKMKDSSYTTQDYIYIWENAEFENQGWPGSGTQEDPYIIENLRITQFVLISDTTYHFVIRNCVFGLDNYSHYLYRWWGDFSIDTRLPSAISFHNVTNAFISNSVIKYCNSAISFDNCINITLRNNYIHAYQPIQDWHGCNNTIENNIVTRGTRGIVLRETQGSAIFNNTVFNCEVGLFIIDSTDYNWIYGNHIGYNGLNAEVYNSSVHWDDGVQIGNAWDDYSGDGWYSIPGESEQVDHFPSQFVGDFLGPVIIAVDVPRSPINIFYYPIRFGFVVEVTDYSGIDDVCLYYRIAADWYKLMTTKVECVKMNQEQGNSTHSRFSYSFEIATTCMELQYSIMANDSLGIESFGDDTYLNGVAGMVNLYDRTGEFIIFQLTSLSLGITTFILAREIYKRRIKAPA
jgi:parallel beta-helix repeat protein